MVATRKKRKETEAKAASRDGLECRLRSHCTQEVSESRGMTRLGITSGKDYVIQRTVTLSILAQAKCVIFAVSADSRDRGREQWC